MGYIIGIFNKYDIWDRCHAKFRVEINGNQYAVFEVEMEWGLPKLPTRVDRNETGHEYKIYERMEDAIGFLQQMKMVNAR